MQKPLRAIRREFGIVNLVVEATPTGVKIWACSPKEGISVFRLKATGGEIVYNSNVQDFHDVVILSTVATKRVKRSVKE